MDKSYWVGIAAILVTILGGFFGLSRRVGQLEVKIETMWHWFVRETGDRRPGGRRHFDPPSDENEE